MTDVDPKRMEVLAIGYAMGRIDEFARPSFPIVAMSHFVDAVLAGDVETPGFRALYERLACETTTSVTETPKAA